MFPDFNLLISLAIKIFALLGTAIYVVFAVIVVKQVATMTKNINDKFNTILIAFSYLHLVFSILIVFLSLIVL